MYSYKELRKAAREACDGPKTRVAVLGNVSTQFLAEAIKGEMQCRKNAVDVYDAPYNQIELCLFDDASDMYLFEPDYIVIWVSSYKLYEDYMKEEFYLHDSFAERMMEKVEAYWSAIMLRSGAKILQMNFVEIEDKVLGNFSSKMTHCFVSQIRKLNYLLQEKMEKHENVYPVDLCSIQNRIGREKFVDTVLYCASKCAVSFNGVPYITEAIGDIINATQGKVKKCLVLDLDGTLWGGVVGDDGIGEIEIGEYKRGPAFTLFQLWVKQLKENGIILAVCSKNNEEVAKEPFLCRDEMVLKLEDFSAFVANWNDKVTNLRDIQEKLNIGMDAMVFIDDSIFEREMVRKMLPEVVVPELPEEPSEYVDFLCKMNLFETASYSAENRDRTEMYRAEAKRVEAKNSCSSIEDYLVGLEMCCETEEFSETCFSRIAQLTQRSNQFNLRTVRYSESDIRNITASGKYYTRMYSLYDRFGGYGIVSLVILEKLGSELFVDTWVMSCRAMNRGLEQFVMNDIYDIAEAFGATSIVGEYIPTPKNVVVKDLYEKMGFTPIDGDRYRLLVCEYKSKQTYVRKRR